MLLTTQKSGEQGEERSEEMVVEYGSVFHLLIALCPITDILVWSYYMGGMISIEIWRFIETWQRSSF